MSKIYVVGHVNPDTDAIASAIGYAWLLNSGNDEEVVPARVGQINMQTAWALDSVGLSAPELLADASPRFDAVARRLDTVTPDRPLREAWAIASRTGTVAPVVEADGKPYGLITGLSLFNALSQWIGAKPEQQQMRLTEIFEIACEQAADIDVPIFKSSSRIRDALPRILRTERNDFWVVDEDGHYLGVCRQSDLLNPPRLKVVLVDHNEIGQSIGSLDEADLIEVLDHHRLGNPPTRLPIRFQVEPVGSTSTLVSERIEESGLSAPPAVAGLMLAGLLADTLRLTSPTTTERDHQAADRLGRWAFVGGSPLEGEDIDSYGRAVLEAGAGLAARDPDSIVTSDLKVYKAAEIKFGIAQVEVTDLLKIPDYLEVLRDALDRLQEGRGLDFTMLMVTDVVDASSRIITRGAPLVLEDLPYKRLADDTWEARGVVSRKKQLLPAVLALLEE